MKTKNFEILVENRIEKMKDTFIDREGMYATDDDRLKQFKMISALTGLSPVKVAFVLVAKHFTALRLAIDLPKRLEDPELRNNLFTDIPNYSILIEALVAEGETF